MKKATALTAVLFLAFATAAFGDGGMQIKIDNCSFALACTADGFRDRVYSVFAA